MAKKFIRALINPFQQINFSLLCCLTIFLSAPLSACRHNNDPEIHLWDVLEHLGDGDFGKAARDCWDAYIDSLDRYTEEDIAELPSDGV